MHKINNQPTRIYRSTDADAPQLSNQAGALLNIFKACLVTGYGTQQPIGWQISHENIAEHKAILQSSNPVTQHHQIIVNDSGAYALLGICTNPVNIDAPNIAYGRLFDSVDAGSAYINRNVGEWTIVANDVYCWLFCTDVGADRHSWYFFGALHPLSSDVSIVTAVIGSVYSNNNSYSNNALSFGSTNRSVILTDREKEFKLKSVIGIIEKNLATTEFNLSRVVQPNLIWGDILFWDGANPVAILPVVKYANYKKQMNSFDEIETDVYGLNTGGKDALDWLFVLEVNR